MQNPFTIFKKYKELGSKHNKLVANSTASEIKTAILKARIKRRDKTIAELKEVIKITEEKCVSAKGVIEKILKRGIKWYDPAEIKDKGKRSNYYHEAQGILRSVVFVNESNRIIKDQVEECARECNDFPEVRDSRMTINGIELLKEALEDIEDPKYDTSSLNREDEDDEEELIDLEDKS